MTGFETNVGPHSHPQYLDLWQSPCHIRMRRIWGSHFSERLFVGPTQPAYVYSQVLSGTLSSNVSSLDSSVVFLLPPGPLLSSMGFYTEPDGGRSSGPFSVPRFQGVRERAVAFLALKGTWVSLGRRLTASLCAALHPSDNVWHLLLLGWNFYRRSRSGPLIAKCNVGFNAPR